MRYRDLARIDLNLAKEKVRQWMLAHPGGTPAQMAADLQGGYRSSLNTWRSCSAVSWPLCRTTRKTSTPEQVAHE